MVLSNFKKVVFLSLSLFFVAPSNTKADIIDGIREHPRIVIGSLLGATLIDGYFLYTTYAEKCKKDGIKALGRLSFFKKLLVDSKFRSTINGTGLFAIFAGTTIIAGLAAATAPKQGICSDVLNTAIETTKYHRLNNLTIQLGTLKTKRGSDRYAVRQGKDYCLWQALVAAIDQDNLNVFKAFVPRHMELNDVKPCGRSDTSHTVAQMVNHDAISHPKILNYVQQLCKPQPTPPAGGQQPQTSAPVIVGVTQPAFDMVLENLIESHKGDPELTQHIKTIFQSLMVRSGEVGKNGGDLAALHDCIWMTLIAAIEQDNLEVFNLLLNSYQLTALSEKPYGQSRSLKDIMKFHANYLRTQHLPTNIYDYLLSQKPN